LQSIYKRIYYFTPKIVKFNRLCTNAVKHLTVVYTMLLILLILLTTYTVRCCTLLLYSLYLCHAVLRIAAA